MSSVKKLMMSAAGGAGLDVDEVFSIDLFVGNSSSQTINNGIDFANEGGMFWNKSRTGLRYHHLSNTETGVGRHYMTGEARWDNTSLGLNSFNSNGVSIGNWFDMNRTGEEHANWSFRNCPKFFQVIRYTGNGTAGRTISHDLGSNVGCMAIHSETNNRSALVWHRGLSNTSNGYLNFRTTAAEATDSSLWNGTAPTSTTITLGTSSAVNSNGEVYIMYLWAHNNNDGNFGPNGDADIIKCGTFTTDGSGFGQDVNLGWEPQFLIVKRYDSAGGGDWQMIDTLRGYPAYKNANNATQRLKIEESSNEATQIYGGILSGTGFKIQDNANADYIYIAIRRGSLFPPESATEVFDPIAANNSAGTFNTTGFPVDLQIFKPYSSTDDWFVNDRMRGVETLSTQTGTSGPYIRTNTANGEVENYMTMGWNNEGFRTASGGYPNNDVVYYNWKRAPGFCDVVAYTGAGANTVINHSLGAIPEMVWVKNRIRSTNWNVYHKDLELNGDPASECRLFLNTTSTVSSGAVFWGTHTDTTFTMTVQNFQTNYPNDKYIAYLFASLPGISKVGSYVGSSSDLTVDCGFTSGARFVLIKSYEGGSGNWFVFDTERGIVAGNDPELSLNLTDASGDSPNDYIDPHSSGFTILGGKTMNKTGVSFIYYAIA